MKHTCPNWGYPRTPPRDASCPECGLEYRQACEASASRLLRRGLVLGLGLCFFWPLRWYLDYLRLGSDEVFASLTFFMPLLAFLSLLSATLTWGVSAPVSRPGTVIGVSALIAFGVGGACQWPMNTVANVLTGTIPLGAFGVALGLCVPPLGAILFSVVTVAWYTMRLRDPAPPPLDP